MIKIIGTDNFNRESVADVLLMDHIPTHHRADAEMACTFLNKFTCDDSGGTHYVVVPGDYRLSRGMADLV